MRMDVKTAAKDTIMWVRWSRYDCPQRCKRNYHRLSNMYYMEKLKRASVVHTIKIQKFEKNCESLKIQKRFSSEFS